MNSFKIFLALAFLALLIIIFWNRIKAFFYPVNTIININPPAIPKDGDACKTSDGKDGVLNNNVCTIYPDGTPCLANGKTGTIKTGQCVYVDIMALKLKVISPYGAQPGTFDTTGCLMPANAPVVPLNDVSPVLEVKQGDCLSSANILVRTQYGWFSLSNAGIVSLVA